MKARGRPKSYLYTRMEPATIWRGWQTRSVGLHIQIPFCKGICKYCPFNKALWQPERLIECQSSLLKLTLKGMHYYDRMAQQHANRIGKLAEECMRTPQPTRIEVPAFHH